MSNYAKSSNNFIFPQEILSNSRTICLELFFWR